MAVIVLDLGVVAAHDADGTTDLACLDGLDERLRRPAQRPHDGFDAKIRPPRSWGPPGIITFAPVGVILHRRADHFHGFFKGVVRVKFVVLHMGELGLVTGADHFGVVAGRPPCPCDGMMHW
jgi:hypothetical protein